MKKCPVCGGAETCPDGDPIRTVKEDDILELRHDAKIPAGYQVMHRTRRCIIAVPEKVTIAGTAQSDRILAHNPHLRKAWVGQCAYVFLPREEA